MDPKLKEAFQKIKQDILALGNEISEIKLEIINLNQKTTSLSKILKKIEDSAVRHTNSTDTSTFSTHLNNSTHLSTHNYPFQNLKHTNLDISTGNEGVSTDRQTDNQTDKLSQKTPQFQLETPKNNLKNAKILLESLDDLKKEIRIKFKRLTNQEFLVFSLIYQFEQEGKEADYTNLSLKLNLSESSIRDYVSRIIKKGIPLYKQRINNKKILIKIDPNLKQIASLNTILQLRNL